MALATINGEFALSDLIRGAAAHALAFPSQHHISPRIEDRIMSGTLMAAEVQPGLISSGRDIRYLEDGAFEGETARSLTCGLLLEGEADPLEVPGYPAVRHQPRRVTIVGFGETLPWRRAYHAQQCSRAFGLTITPSFLDRFASSVAQRDLPALRAMLDGKFQVRQLPASSLLVSLATQVFEHPYVGALSDLFQESIALRFVAEIEQLLGEDAQLEARLGAKRYDRVRRAKEILDHSLAQPPKTLDLAQQLATNVASLQADFKRAYGTTLFGYVRDHRLAVARVLIEEHRLSIAAAGYRVGFTSASAFAAAFRRHFGLAPSKLR